MRKGTVVKVALAMVIPAYIWQGFVLSKMWGWFVVTAFNAPQITIAIAIGLILICSMVTNKSQSGENSNDEASGAIGRMIGLNFGYPLLVLVVGYVLSGFVG